MDKFKHLLENLECFVICSEQTYAKLNKTHTEVKFYDALDDSNSTFFKKVLELDEKCFDHSGMGMPGWVFFDCAMMPGVVFGLGINSEKLSQADKKFLNIKSQCFYPLSMYAALPDLNQNWFGHNLSSLNGKLEYKLAGLGQLTKALALELLPANKIRGATQWDSPALGLHLKFGPIKLLSVNVSVHSKSNTLCYEYIDFKVEGSKRKKLTNELILELRKLVQAGEQVIMTKKEGDFIWLC